MKSAYEIAMARLEKEKGPSRKLSDEQKAEIAAINKKYDARAAEEKLSFETRMSKAANFEELENLRKEMAASLTTIEEQREKARESVWDRD
ncbi:MAG: hypothetical protein IT366_16445 [Candidatus Hydrogenedentes bacterium]|nr:hypothetical protein [Candidatus Hydrogenedentota bacterium]